MLLEGKIQLHCDKDKLYENVCL